MLLPLIANPRDSAHLSSGPFGIIYAPDPAEYAAPNGARVLLGFLNYKYISPTGFNVQRLAAQIGIH